MKFFPQYYLLLILFAFSFNLSSQPYLIGMTERGGNGFGAIFQTDINGENLNVLDNFEPNVAGGNWDFVGQKLCLATNGKIYGVSSSKGGIGNGIIFEYDPITDNYTKIFDFYQYGGIHPCGGIIQGPNGKLYGLTKEGGNHDLGVIYEFDINTNTYTNKFSFGGVNIGAHPLGNLVFGGDGMLYGVTSSGTASDGKGVLFQFDLSTNIFTIKHQFTVPLGGNSHGNLMLAPNGKLYGSGNNILFEYDIVTSSLTIKQNLGYEINGPLLYATNDTLYYSGGTFIHAYDINSNTVVQKLNFTSSIGTNANGWLMQSTDGFIYGLTETGGLIIAEHYLDII